MIDYLVLNRHQLSHVSLIHHSLVYALEISLESIGQKSYLSKYRLNKTWAEKVKEINENIFKTNFSPE